MSKMTDHVLSLVTVVTDGGKCYVATFGCRVNQADTEGYVDTLKAKNFTPSDSHRDADIVVVNSCTVTHRSDADIRKLVNRIQRENPQAKVIVTGCYAQRDPNALVQLSGTHAVIGNSDRHRLAEVVDRLTQKESEPSDTIVIRSEMTGLEAEDLPPVEPVSVVNDRTRPFVKIQDGCDARCTYCVIPSVRGPARSAPANAVIDSVKCLVEQGYFEVVLAGIHLGTYAHGDDTLDTVVRQVLQNIPSLGRLRISCIEPMAFPMALADIAKEDSRLAPHFHLPLQSGDNTVLKRMSRPYREQDFQAIIDGIRQRISHACLGTDVIVGFPGESEAQFENTYRFVEASGLNYVHVFSYSDRPGIPSTRLKDKVDPRVVKERSRRLNDLSTKLWANYLDQQVGKELSAVTLKQNYEMPLTSDALSDNYCQIRIENQRLSSNTCVRVKITARRENQLCGLVVSSRPADVSAAPPL
jgi:threonylcarbamoyladenosine tRNA methylthiotransferase MtaB